jgi:putative membrane protein
LHDFRLNKIKTMKNLILNLAIVMALSSFHYPYKAVPDKAFLIAAAQGNIAEIDAAKLALAQSASDSVKAFAQMMIADHTDAQTQLAALAQQQSVTLPDSADDAHRMFKQRLTMVTGKSFDSAYMQSQVQDHIKTVALFEQEIQNGLDQQDKDFASKLLPKLRMHLQHAQNVAQSSAMQAPQQ